MLDKSRRTAGFIYDKFALQNAYHPLLSIELEMTYEKDYFCVRCFFSCVGGCFC